jgi:hypothetical protein
VRDLIGRRDYKVGLTEPGVCAREDVRALGRVTTVTRELSRHRRFH